MSLEQIRERLEVAERLAHLAPLEQQQPSVNPKASHRRAMHERLALGDLVFVMRKDQVGAATVDVEAVSGRVEQVARHRRALDVPARTARAVGLERPRRLAGLGKLPEGEVERVVLVLVHFDARAHQQLVDVAPAQMPVPRERADAIVNAVLARVRVLLLDQFADHRLNGGDEGRRVRLGVGLAHAQLPHRGFELGIVTGDDLAPVFARLQRARDGPVVDVGHVLHVRDAIPPKLQIAAQDVEEQERTSVSEMRLRRRRQPAHVDAHVTVAQRREVLGLASKRVVKFETHYAVR